MHALFFIFLGLVSAQFNNYAFGERAKVYRYDLIHPCYLVTIHGDRYRPGGQSPGLVPLVTTEVPLNGYSNYLSN